MNEHLEVTIKARFNRRFHDKAYDWMMEMEKNGYTVESATGITGKNMYPTVDTEIVLVKIEPLPFSNEI